MSDEAAPGIGAVPVLQPPEVSPFRASWRRFARSKLAVGSLIILGLIVVACFFGPFLFPYGPEDSDFDNIQAPINLFSIHPFGTDAFGRDLLLQVLIGGQVSLAVGFFGAVAALLIGLIYGAWAGYIGGRVDNVLMRIVDVL